MSSEELSVVLKRFDAPDEVREFERGRFELVRLGGLTIGRTIAGSLAISLTFRFTFSARLTMLP